MTTSSTTRQNADYGYDIQRLYLEMMLSDAETFVRCQSIFDHERWKKRQRILLIQIHL